MLYLENWTLLDFIKSATLQLSFWPYRSLINSEWHYTIHTTHTIHNTNTSELMEGGNYFLQLAFVSSVDQVVETVSKLAFVFSAWSSSYPIPQSDSKVMESYLIPQNDSEVMECYRIPQSDSELMESYRIPLQLAFVSSADQVVETVGTFSAVGICVISGSSCWDYQ